MRSSARGQRAGNTVLARGPALVDLSAVTLAIQAGGFGAAAIALGISAYNTVSTRKINEINSLFNITQKYAEYSGALERIGDTPPRNVAKRAFANMANHIENLCTIYRHKHSTRLILENIEALVSDHIAASNHELRPVGIDYQLLLTSFGYGPDSFADTHWFIRQKSRLIAAKAERIALCEPAGRPPSVSGPS